MTETCQRNVAGRQEQYLQCGAPAVAIMRDPRDDGAEPVGYAMCADCARDTGWTAVRKGQRYQPVISDSLDKLRNAKNEAESLDVDTADSASNADDVEIEEAPPPPEDKLKAITELAREQLRLLRKEALLKKELAEVTEQLNANQMAKLPKAMSEADVEEFQLKGGYGVAIEKFVHASIPSLSAKNMTKDEAKEKNERGIAYMDEQAPDLVKNLISIEFGRGEEKFFAKFLRDLAQRKRPVKAAFTRSVHASTLGKWVRERIEKGMSVDEEALNVHRTVKALVTLPDGEELIKG